MSRKSVPPAIPLARPSLPELGELAPLLDKIWQSGIVTTGPLVSAFETAVAEDLGVAHAVMVNHGTTALMLAIKALGLTGEVVVPSFSWTATAAALVWNGVEPVFADITPNRLTLDPTAAEGAISPRTTAIMPVNVFGTPPDIGAFEEISRKHSIPVLYDSAQGLGSRYEGRRCGGFGVAECFSLSPTKVVTAVEGGLVTTNDGRLAAEVRSLRDSGKTQDGSDIARVGLSGRPSEIHAAIAIKTLRRMEPLMEERAELISWYHEALEGVSGIRFQAIPDDVYPVGSYFVIRLDSAVAGISSSDLRWILLDNGIESKMYFHPAIHMQRAYKHLRLRYEGRLPETEKASAEGLALPLFGGMRRDEVERVCSVIRDALGAGKRHKQAV